MDGIHILNQTVIMETVGWYVPVLFICGILAGICFAIAIDTYDDGLRGFGVIVGIVLICILIAIGVWEPKVETDRYRYEATVGDYIRFSDVYEKYDVVERRGEIWVLEDKEIDE